MTFCYEKINSRIGRIRIAQNNSKVEGGMSW
jgi:hypothetical protein